LYHLCDLKHRKVTENLKKERCEKMKNTFAKVIIIKKLDAKFIFISLFVILKHQISHSKYFNKPTYR